MDRPRLVVLMGVAGAGKTVVGRALAARLGWRFLEGDDFHPAANIEKMGAGIPLTDSDRAPWLDAVGGRMAQMYRQGESVVVACSALRSIYRERLSNHAPFTAFVHLRVRKASLADRLRNRKGHFVDGRLLDSQLETLEEPSPDEAFLVEADRPVPEIVDEIATWLEAHSQES